MTEPFVCGAPSRALTAVKTLLLYLPTALTSVNSASYATPGSYRLARIEGGTKRKTGGWTEKREIRGKKRRRKGEQYEDQGMLLYEVYISEGIISWRCQFKAPKPFVEMLHLVSSS